MVQTPPSTFPQYAQQLRTEINDALDEYSRFDGDCPEILKESIRYSLLAPGKRLRPMLVLMATEACGYDREVAMPAAGAVEMIHCYSLIHDDLPAMDDDDLRRGLPTCHAKFGEANAILAGDALIPRAFELLATKIEPPELAAACCAELARAAGASALVGGQVDDLGAENLDGTVETLEAIHRRKTGAMFLVSLRLGAMVSRANEEQLEALTIYGKRLGLAFQVVDDLLDVRSTDQAMGKRTQKDSDRGKLTFPSLLGVEESGNRAKRLIEEACDALKCFGDSASELEKLARFVLERNQ
jgi:geranylgeranyl diphosphate synthase type II